VPRGELAVIWDLGLTLYRWLLRHAGPGMFTAPKRRVIRGEVESKSNVKP
jgi:hypothetical protein